MDCDSRLARSAGHSSYQRMNELLDGEKFDEFVEGLPGRQRKRQRNWKGKADNSREGMGSGGESKVTMGGVHSDGARYTTA